jgi:selenocysteine lyase/cysteine desulfurase
MSDLLISCQRDLFDVPDDVCYLNCAYMSPQLAAVSSAGREAVGLKARPWLLTEEHWFGRVEAARSRFGQVIGASADEVALVPSASYGIGTAARNCPLEPGQTIILLAEQFPSCVYPWMRRARESGGRIVTVERPSDHDWTGAILENIDERTAVVMTPAFHWADGGRVDLARIGQAVREFGAQLVLDLSQSAGASTIDVADIAAVDPDWLCAPTYKWLLGPYSAGFLYVAPRNHEGVPLEENWIVRSGSGDFSRLVDYEDRYREGARRYDVGERSNFALLPMVNAGLDQVLAWGVDRIEATLAVTTARLEEIGADAGFRAAPREQRAPHFIGLSREAGLPEDLVARFREQSVYVGTRGASLRVAPHLHTSDADLDRFAEALRSLDR